MHTYTNQPTLILIVITFVYRGNCNPPPTPSHPHSLKFGASDSLAHNCSSCSPHYFKHIKISALALLKMVMHARSGGNMEVMGLLLGKVDGNTMIVMDGVALPVEGTETRVNAQAQAYEYMASYTEAAKQVSGTHCGQMFFF